MEADKTNLEAQLRASLNGARERGRRVNAAEDAPMATRAPGKRRAGAAKGRGRATDADAKESLPSGTPAPIANGTSPVRELCGTDQMTLRQKLGEVRRRIGYIQKRGYNERSNYNYVTAADIAGTSATSNGISWYCRGW